jgi:hypothetical protein
MRLMRSPCCVSEYLPRFRFLCSPRRIKVKQAINSFQNPQVFAFCLPQSHQTNSGIVPRLGYDHFLPIRRSSILQLDSLHTDRVVSELHIMATP